MPWDKKEESLLFGLVIVQGRRGLICSSVASASLESEEDLSYLYWVSMLEERPALGVLSTSKGAHAHGEAYTIVSHHPWGV